MTTFPQFATLLALATTLSSRGAAPPEDTGPEWATRMQVALREEATRIDGQWLAGVADRQQWEAARPELHRQYMEMLGLWPLPERTPLRAQVTSVLQREGFRVEKLHFQSRPHLYVTANLYLPQDAQPGSKLPAVLYVCGHSGRGRDGNKAAFQHHGMWFATHGYACLIVDTLQLGEIAAIHHGTYRYNRWWWYARGYTPAGVECWNGLRALDYLQSRPEVDPERLGVTGISGGGAATFWIAAADERVKVAVPVSGMSDLEDYVGDKVVNGHCDCMFFHNTFQWPWSQIAALVAPRPMLFENSGHDTIFPMTGNDRIRARLEKLYGFYTNRTDGLFDLGVTPGGHEDKPELRLMAYRWLNRFLKQDDAPVTEPDLPKIDGALLRVFPDELPADELNSRIDETFVPAASNSLPRAAEFGQWRDARMAELRRLVFRPLAHHTNQGGGIVLGKVDKTSGVLLLSPGLTVSYEFQRGQRGTGQDVGWMAVLSEEDSFSAPPAWLQSVVGEASVLLIKTGGIVEARRKDPAPFYVQRALALLGQTIDGLQVEGVKTLATSVLDGADHRRWNVAGRGAAGIVAAYVALLEPRLGSVVVLDPPASHQEGPIFLNVLRVLDVPSALGLLAPRPLTVIGAREELFESTRSLYQLVNASLKFQPGL